jgi:O-acetyl-ADP-ribose deacetylase
MTERRFPNGSTLRLVRGDITKIEADAIVNAANAALAGGGGVDGAIHRAGGPSIMRELDRIRAEIGHCETGCAVATEAGLLPAKWVFHAVGPVYRGGRGREAELLASCYRACLDLAEKHGAQRVTFPAISTGIYGYPMEEAAEIALRAIVDRLAAGAGAMRQVVFVLYDNRALAVFARALDAAG